MSGVLKDLERLGIGQPHDRVDLNDVRKAALKLRSQQFLFSDGKAGKYYDLICKKSTYFKALADAFDDELIIDREYGFCGIVPRNSFNKLDLITTLFILVLAKMHDGEIRKGLSDNGRTSPPPEIILSEFEILTGRNKPKKEKYNEVMDKLRSCGLVRFTSYHRDEHNDMRPIEILPSILIVASRSWLEKLEDHCNSKSHANNSSVITSENNKAVDGENCEMAALTFEIDISKEET